MAVAIPLARYGAQAADSNGPGDASRGAIAETYRAGVPLRSIALRMTDASPLRVPGTGRRPRIQWAGQASAVGRALRAGHAREACLSAAWIPDLPP